MTASPGWTWETGTSTSPCSVRSQTRSILSDIQRARSSIDFFRVHSSSSSPTSSRNITAPAVPKSPRQAEIEIDRASSRSTFILRRNRQRNPRLTKGTICQRIRAILKGGGKNSVQAAFSIILPTNFSSNSRFKARLLCAGKFTFFSASFQEKRRKSSNTARLSPL